MDKMGVPVDVTPSKTLRLLFDCIPHWLSHSAYFSRVPMVTMHTWLNVSNMGMRWNTVNDHRVMRHCWQYVSCWDEQRLVVVVVFGFVVRHPTFLRYLVRRRNSMNQALGRWDSSPRTYDPHRNPLCLHEYQLQYVSL